MVGAANDVRNAEIDIIGDNAQVISRAAVGPQQNKVFQFSVRKLNCTENGVIKSGAASFRNRKPQSRGLTSILAAHCFACLNSPARSLIPRRPTFSCSFRPASLKFLSAAEAVVSGAGFEEAGGGGAGEIEPLRPAM